MMPLVSTIGSSSSKHPLPPPPPIKIKKKRNVGGNPDPDATVVAVSPRTLMEANQFLCEICYKPFVREQNMQMHYRSHNREWKLGTREKVKRVFVCPDERCVHHHPSRALCDFSAIRKHYIRKHGEKKWKCQTCTKAYAVEGDLKAHAKVCGSKHYKCDRCTYTAYRKDSFVNHKKVCDDLTANLAIMSTTLPQTPTSYQSLLHPLMPEMLASIPNHFSTTYMFPPVVSTGDYFNSGSFGVGGFSPTPLFPPFLPSENFPGDIHNPGLLDVSDFSNTPFFSTVLPSENYPENTFNPGSFGVGDIFTTPLFPPVLPSEDYPGDTLDPSSFGVGDISRTPLISPVLPSENYPGDILNSGSFGVGDSSTTLLFPPVLPSENYPGDALDPSSFSTASLFSPIVSSENHTGDALNHSFFPPPDVSLENYTGDSLDHVGNFSHLLPGTSFDMSGGTIGEGASSQDLGGLPPLPESLEIQSLPENESNLDMLGFPWPNWN